MRVAAAVVVAAGALAGCGGGPVKMGAAALVGDDRISVTTLDQAVRDWQRQFKTDQNANQMRADPGNPEQQVASDTLSESDLRGALAVLVNFRIGKKVAASSGVHISETQVDQVIASLDRQGGAGSTTLANGLPRSYTRELARFLATRDQVAAKAGADGNPQSPQTMQAQQQTARLFMDTANGMKIKVNPRFGSFDPNQVTIRPVTARLSAADPGIR
ncbi:MULTISPECIES: hypothetical protein [Thermomonosporaceae]|uniref:hypothetical protein n=1 Tax=Thermomonosporaceae TaxID=2012 RepID=UPI00255ACEA1|nr:MULTISPECIES: hypothetical protein [Thermomonosporaceae]MDL4772320.1 hypothetical protein [Actinomadura xylanilytica]